MLELEKTARLPRESTRDYVYGLLRDHIIRLKLKPGQLISENDIAAQLQLSRTPVREALIRLSQEQLLEVQPQRGTYVSLIDMEQVEEARFVREQLEPAIAKLACERFPAEQFIRLETNLLLFERIIEEQDYARLFELDVEFHQALFIGCGRERTWQIVYALNAHLSRIRMLSMASAFNWDTILEQHRAIVKAIRSKDAEQAERIMKEHVSLIVRDQESLMRTYSEYFKLSH